MNARGRVAVASLLCAHKCLRSAENAWLLLSSTQQQGSKEEKHSETRSGIGSVPGVIPNSTTLAQEKSLYQVIFESCLLMIGGVFSSWSIYTKEGLRKG